MDDRTKRNILFAVTVPASLLLIAYSAGVFTSLPIDEARTVDGEVLAVESPSSNTQQGEAVIRLATGETVRAVVPSACVLAPGQMARLSQLDGGVLGTRGYVVRNAWNKKG